MFNRENLRGRDEYARSLSFFHTHRKMSIVNLLANILEGILCLIENREPKYYPVGVIFEDLPKGINYTTIFDDSGLIDTYDAFSRLVDPLSECCVNRLSISAVSKASNVNCNSCCDFSKAVYRGFEAGDGSNYPPESAGPIDDSLNREISCILGTLKRHYFTPENSCSLYNQCERRKKFIERMYMAEESVVHARLIRVKKDALERMNSLVLELHFEKVITKSNDLKLEELLTLSTMAG